ncbi:MAG TPA: MetQ/NlpA family ABC transporter substrate-binding protein [Clostridia bacterium]|jgi:D-methionine transport system substrate-binding protein|nr:MetQ/NlpA family ABC transporter substrate-binding protein [Clostridia bacterium]
MKKFRKLALIGLVVCLFATVIAGCGQKPAENGQAEGDKQKLVVGVTPVPHGEILEVAKEILAKENIEVEIKEFTDYPIVNPALADKQLDANYFQHIPYMEDYNAKSDTKLVALAKVHIEPMAIYSKKITDLKDLPNGAKVAVPNDATNEGRALLLLESAGLITLKKDAGLEATVSDIESNPKNLKITELDAAQLPNALNDVDIAAINGNFALDAGLNPVKDSLFIEDSNSPYVNILAVRAGDENNELLKKLAAALTSPEVKKFIEDTYQGAVVPVF